MRGTWVLRNGEMVLKGGALDVRPAVARSSLPRPMIISDSMNDVVNPLDGKPYSSKAAYYRTVRANDCEILGNETIKPRDNDTDAAHGIENDIARAIDSVS